jgi:hypothetical protein
MRVGVDVQRVVRTCLHTRFATNATVFVEIDDAIGSKIQGFDRTNLHTRRVSAMIAAHHRKKTAGIGESPFFDLLDVRSEHPDRHFMFRFASRRTGVTANTFAVINNESVFHKLILIVGIAVLF